MTEHCAQIIRLSEEHCCKAFKIIELSVFQDFWDGILEVKAGKVDSEIRDQVILVQTQKQSFNIFF